MHRTDVELSPDPFDKLTAGERRREIAAVLAAGILRLRTEDLANDADLRRKAPKRSRDVMSNLVATGELPASHDPRLPMPGVELTREYKGRTVTCEVRVNGFEHDGQVYSSLTAVARAITGSHWNGYHFFGLRRDS